MIGQFGVWLGGGLLLLTTAALVGMYIAAKRAGRLSAERDAALEMISNARKANDARSTVDVMPDGAAADELRKHWSR